MKTFKCNNIEFTSALELVEYYRKTFLLSTKAHDIMSSSGLNDTYTETIKNDHSVYSFSNTAKADYYHKLLVSKLTTEELDKLDIRRYKNMLKINLS